MVGLNQQTFNYSLLIMFLKEHDVIKVEYKASQRKWYYYANETQKQL